MSLLSNFYKTWAFSARSTLVNRRNVFAIFEMVFWPFIAIFSVGLLTRFLHLGPETVTFILIGAVAMTKFQRIYEAAMLRTLGASRRTVFQGIAAEFVVLGVLARMHGFRLWQLLRYIREELLVVLGTDLLLAVGLFIAAALVVLVPPVPPDRSHPAGAFPHGQLHRVARNLPRLA